MCWYSQKFIVIRYLFRVNCGSPVYWYIVAPLPSIYAMDHPDFIACTVKPVLSAHSKIDKTKILMANGSLMKVKSIAECSEGITGLEKHFLRAAILDRFYCSFKESKPPDKSVFCKTIFYFSSKAYVVGTQKNCLNETVLLSTQNTCLN